MQACGKSSEASTKRKVWFKPFIHENSNSQLGELFKKTVGVCQGCLLSRILFNVLIERNTLETLNDHNISISIAGRPIRNLRFTDDIDLMGGSNGELQDLANRLVDRAKAYGMDVSTEKSKITTNSTNNISADISLNG